MIPFHPHAPPPAPFERDVERTWHASGRTPETIREYAVWVRRFYAYCSRAKLDPACELTLAGVVKFSHAHVGQRTRRHPNEGGRHQARVALHAWSCALSVLGQIVPEWSEPPARRTLPKLVAEYHEFRVRHCGVAASTLTKDADTAETFLAFLRSRGRPLARTGVVDLDEFVAGLARRWVQRTVSTACSTLRVFLRFLQSTGRLSRDLASSVVAPQAKPMDSPPRALPWPLVRRLLRSIRQDGPTGRRDYAIILLMAAYGMGAGEVMMLHLEDIDWVNRVLRIRRPKTGVPVLLPLLPAAARALAQYIQHERPPHAASRGVFVRKDVPHRRISSSGSIFYMVRKTRASSRPQDRAPREPRFPAQPCVPAG